ncbi:hypothetical protein [Desulfitobacterium sp. AusDCA]
MESLVKGDAEAFYPLSQAYGLPKNTEEEIRTCVQNADFYHP